MTNSQRPTIIEKYANRRFYNTGTLAFVTLDELAATLKREKKFLVYDTQTGADITRSVLGTDRLSTGIVLKTGHCMLPMSVSGVQWQDCNIRRQAPSGRPMRDQFYPRQTHSTA